MRHVQEDSQEDWNVSALLWGATGCAFPSETCHGVWLSALLSVECDEIRLLLTAIVTVAVLMSE